MKTLHRSIGPKKATQPKKAAASRTYGSASSEATAGSSEISKVDALLTRIERRNRELSQSADRLLKLVS